VDGDVILRSNQKTKGRGHLDGDEHVEIVLHAYIFVTRSQAVARIVDRTVSQHLWRVTWRHRSRYHLIPICHFLLVVLGTESLSPAVVDILHSKRIGVTSLTFQGHVTSSVTW